MTVTTRMELRFAQIQAPTPAVKAISKVLERLLKDTQLGVYDAYELFDQLALKGLSPRWTSPVNIRVEDTVAGPLLVCFEPLMVTVH